MSNRAKEIYENTLAIIQDIEERYKANELSESSLKQRNNAISSSRRRINTPEITKSIMGPDETTIRNKLTDLFNVNNNPIIKLKELAILLVKLNDFDNDYAHIYLILVWITLYISRSTSSLLYPNMFVPIPIILISM